MEVEKLNFIWHQIRNKDAMRQFKSKLIPKDV